MMQRLARVATSQASGLLMLPALETMIRKVSWRRSSASCGGMRYRLRTRLSRGSARARISSREGSARSGGTEALMIDLSVSKNAAYQPTPRLSSGGGGACGRAKRQKIRNPSAWLPRAEARAGVGFLEITGHVPDQAEGDALHLRRLLEDEQRGDRLPVDVPRLED